MSRVVFLMDRVMRPLDFSGKVVVPYSGTLVLSRPSWQPRTIEIGERFNYDFSKLPFTDMFCRLPVLFIIIEW